MRLDYLDGLRGFAILGVVLVHVTQTIVGLPEMLESFGEFGFRGVQLFFIVSAFTLCTTYYNRDFRPAKFYIRRFFRVAPMFYFGCGLYIILRQKFNYDNGIEPYSILDIVLTFGFLHGFKFSSLNSVVPGGWSIASEMMFYLCFPFVLYFIKDLRDSIILFICSTTASILGKILLSDSFALFSHFGFFSQITAFSLGVVLYHVNHEGYLKKISLLYSWIIIILAISTMIACGLSDVKLIKSSLATTYFLAMLCAGVIRLEGKILFNNSIMINLGKISFSMYILHFAVIYFIKSNFIIFAQNPVTGLLVAYFATILISSILSFASYQIVEKYFIKISKMIT